MSNYIIDGIMGLCVADALGVPVEFEYRETLKKNPVVNMRSYGTYNQPAGTWSDDTSMTICLADSLSKGLNYDDIMNNFNKWITNGEYTPYGEVFDVGGSTRSALLKYESKIEPLNCGGVGEHDYGNGSLMRILPIVFYLKSKNITNITKDDRGIYIIHNISKLTHAHKRSLISCGIYCSIAMGLIEKKSKYEAVKNGIYNTINYYKKYDKFEAELHHFQRLYSKNFNELPEEQIRSSGYVVDTLEAALWCFLNTDSYKDCILKSVNLGDDTDTVAAVAGGLAGIYYGYEDIPKEWIDKIAKRHFIEDICNKLYLSFN